MPSSFTRLLLTLLIGSFLGIFFRLYFSPLHLQKILQEQLARARLEGSADIHFQSADLSLRENWFWPRWTLLVTNLQMQLHKECGAAISAHEVQADLSLSALLRGNLQLAKLAVDQIEIDIDATRPLCGRKDANAESSKRETDSPPDSEASHSEKNMKSVTGLAQAWWKESDLAKLQSLIPRVHLHDATLRFEQRQKFVHISDADFRIVSDSEIKAKLTADLPSEILEGEILPPVSMEGNIHPLQASVKASIALDEGKLAVEGTLRPQNRDLYIESTASARNIPISVLVPLLHKAGIIHFDFEPKFSWLNCDAHISGVMQGLLQKNPIDFESCSIEGETLSLRLSPFQKSPTGHFSDLHLSFSGKSASFLDAFRFEGPKGILSDFGNCSGEVEIGEAAQSGEITVTGIRAFFANGGETADQLFDIKLSAERIANDLKLDLKELKVNNGDFAGNAQARLDMQGNGTAQLHIEKLRLSAAVEDLMLAGTLSGFNLKIASTLKNWQLAQAQGHLQLQKLDSEQIDLPSANADLSYLAKTFSIKARAAQFKLPQKGVLIGFFRPLFLGKDLAEQWIEGNDMQATVSLRPEGQWHLDQLRVQLANKIHLSMTGVSNSQKNLQGLLLAEYPHGRLKFDLSGKLNQPMLGINSPSNQSKKEIGPSPDPAFYGL